MPRAVLILFGFRINTHLYHHHLGKKGALIKAHNGGNQQPIAISVGCNKGTDAVKTLRLISRSNRYDVNLWYDAFVRGRNASPAFLSEDKKSRSQMAFK
jgi:hypothetical protein